jgi:hypothetical protein
MATGAVRCTRRVAAALLLYGAAAATAANGDAATAEYQIKAAFLCKFGNYIATPTLVAEQPFVIGVLAGDAVADELAEAAKGQTAQGRPIAVRRLPGPAALEGVGIVFVARSHAAHAGAVIAAAKGRPILTVTEAERGVAGSIVNFVVVDDKVRFDIALEAAEANNLKISARLLAVARNVSGKVS